MLKYNRPEQAMDDSVTGHVRFACWIMKATGKGPSKYSYFFLMFVPFPLYPFSSSFSYFQPYFSNFDIDDVKN